MKSEATVKPSKQRKKIFQASLHARYKLFSAPLSPELKETHGLNSLPVRTGDTVRIMRGDRKGFEGKIIDVDRKKYRVFIEGVTREKVDGTTIFIPIHPSKVMVTGLNLDDKWRRESIKKKKEIRKQIFQEKASEKPSKEEELREKSLEEVAKEEAKEKKKITRKRKPAKRKTIKSRKTKRKEGENNVG